MPSDPPGGSRFAVHVMAHAQPALFGGLVASLRDERIDVYAHIDARVDEAPFRRAAADTGVRFLSGPHRVRVHWAGFSQVQATLNLLRQATGSGIRYHRHTLLSGADVRVRPLPHVIDRWSGDAEDIRIDRVLSAPGSIVRYKADRLHFGDRPALGRLSGRVRRRIPRNRRLVHGSTWWSLTDPAVRYILRTAERDRWWRRFARHAQSPDEFFFHSILAASPYAPAITQDYSGTQSDTAPGPDLHGQHFIRWRTNDPHPQPFRETDLPAAVRSDALFARKVTGDCPWRPR